MNSDRNVFDLLNQAELAWIVDRWIVEPVDSYQSSGIGRMKTPSLPTNGSSSFKEGSRMIYMRSQSLLVEIACLSLSPIID